MDIKRPDYAGSWYPATAEECEAKIDKFLRLPGFGELQPNDYSACISPHAGWYFSGSIACNAIKLLKGATLPDIVVVFGKHLHSTSPATILTGCALETPLGNLETADDFSIDLAKEIPLRKESCHSFGVDNTIETQLPFIKYFFGSAKLVVIGSPPCEFSGEIGKRVVEIAKKSGLKLKIIGSTDMTHYGTDFGYTPAGSGKQAVEWVNNVNDHNMIEAMVGMDVKDVLMHADENRSACCGGAVVATVAAAKELGAEKGQSLAYSTSYDLSPGDSFVGYAGIVY